MFIALIVASFACADPIPKAAPEPAWMANFRKVYQLKEGEYVKRVAAPYIPERIDFIVDAYSPPKDPQADAEGREMIRKYAKWFTVLPEQNGTNLIKRRVLSSVGLSFVVIKKGQDDLLEVSHAVEHITGLSVPEFIIDPRYVHDPLFMKANLTVHGDFVIRRNAPIEKLAEQLELILRNECKVPCKLRVDKVEQEVFVASGEFKLKPPEWRTSSQNERLRKLVDVYSTKDWLIQDFDHFDTSSTKKVGRVESGDYTGTPIELVRFLGERINKRIVWDMELPFETKMTWCDHKLSDPTPQEKVVDTDPEKILKNMTAQTGLTFKKEKRKVPVLVIYPSELK